MSLSKADLGLDPVPLETEGEFYVLEWPISGPSKYYREKLAKIFPTLKVSDYPSMAMIYIARAHLNPEEKSNLRMALALMTAYFFDGVSEALEVLEEKDAIP